MLQNKQEERRLKRIEGDIVKKQRLLRRVMHDYENGKLKNNSQKMYASSDVNIVMMMFFELFLL